MRARKTPGFSIISSAKNGISFIALALREFRRDPKFTIGWLFGLGVIAAAVSFTAMKLQFYAGKPAFASWFYRASVDVTVVGIDVYIYQHILGRYRKISLTARTISRCLGWSAFFLLVGIFFEHLSHPLDALLATHFASADQYAYFHRLFVDIVTAAAMIWIGFYPFLVLEKSPRVWPENRKIVRAVGLKLVIGWVVIWYVTWCIGKLIEAGVLAFLVGQHIDENAQLYAFTLYLRDFLIFAVFIPPAAATTAIAYLRGTGESDFAPARKKRAR